MKKLFRTLIIVAICGATIGMVSCKKDKDDDAAVVINGYEFVDLGLPSGLLWAKCNLGAVSPEDYGNKYGWAETQSRYGDELYNNDNIYIMSDTSIYDSELGGYVPFIYKYNTWPKCGTVDNKTTLEPSDDAATAALGKGAHIPTYDDFAELINYTEGHWTTQNGEYGIKFVSSNGNSIFLPAAGTSNDYKGTSCCYWSSSLGIDYPWNAMSLGGNYFENDIELVETGREGHNSIRAVYSAL